MKLIQKQTVKLALTQELRQAIHLLQLSSQELTAYLEEKALENPLIQLQPPKTTVRKSSTSDWIEQLGQKETSLSDFLTQQLIYLKIPKSLKNKIQFLIYGLDENGYLTLSYLDLLKKYPSLTNKEWEDALTILQGLEPIGVGARNLQECLLIQMKNRAFSEEALWIIDQYFDAFAQKKWQFISQKLKIPISEIQSLSDQIADLHPRPGSLYKKEPSSYITPDCIVSSDNQKYRLKMIEDHIPRVQFHKDYYQRFYQSSDLAVLNYLRQHREDYDWLVKGLESRRSNLQRIISAIVEKQKEFFQKGKGSLRPLTMKEIAVELGIHESTVSRAVRGKYIQSSQGTYPLKSLFASTVEDQSSEHIKLKILQLIDSEDKQQPLSDQMIVEQLEEQDIKVSRRTIAKYREQLGILSSTKRKEFR